VNNTNPTNGSALIFSSDNIEDGDHQLRGSIESLEQNGGIILDYFECVASFIPLCPEHNPDNVAESRIENSSGGGFDLLWAGTNATNVPKEAALVDDSGHNTGIILSDATQWTQRSNSSDLARYQGSNLNTTTAGASFSYTFNGTAIWYDGVSHAMRYSDQRIP
jgi:hypothetical protein